MNLSIGSSGSHISVLFFLQCLCSVWGFDYYHYLAIMSNSLVLNIIVVYVLLVLSYLFFMFSVLYAFQCIMLNNYPFFVAPLVFCFNSILLFIGLSQLLIIPQTRCLSRLLCVKAPRFIFSLAGFFYNTHSDFMSCMLCAISINSVKFGFASI